MPDSAVVRQAPLRSDGALCESRLEVSHLQKFYGSRKAVKDVSLVVCKGEVVGLLGPNGAGKTTSSPLHTTSDTALTALRLP